MNHKSQGFYFRLERMDVVKIEGRHPPVLCLTINRELLESISGEESSSSKVGLALLNNIKKVKVFSIILKMQ